MSNLLHTDSEYFRAIDLVLNKGEFHTDRTGVGTKRYFGAMFKFNLEKEFPIITCKPAAFKNVLREMLWFISGDVSIQGLKDLGGTVYKWWEPFAQEDGTIGPMYSRQMRNFNGNNVDQLQNVIDTIKTNPNSRRILLTSYNPIEAPLGSLYPCHMLLNQFMVTQEGKLNMSTIQRSMDLALGCPHNWIEHALLQHMIANVCGLKVGTMTYFVNDLHLYINHIDKIKDMKRVSYSNPIVSINKKDNIDNYNLEDFTLTNYKAGPVIKLPMAV